MHLRQKNIARDREFLNLWFAKPMVSMQAAFHENDRATKMTKTAKTTQSAKNNELSAGSAVISGVSKRGWQTEGVGARKSLPCHRFRPLFCTLIPIPPDE